MTRRIRDLYDAEWFFFLVVSLLIALLLAVLVWAAVEDSRAWLAYSADHHCRAVGIQRGQVVVTGNGSVGSTSDQTIYHCDAGEVVIR